MDADPPEQIKTPLDLEGEAEQGRNVFVVIGKLGAEFQLHERRLDRMRMCPKSRKSCNML